MYFDAFPCVFPVIVNGIKNGCLPAQAKVYGMEFVQ